MCHLKLGITACDRLRCTWSMTIMQHNIFAAHNLTRTPKGKQHVRKQTQSVLAHALSLLQHNA